MDSVVVNVCENESAVMMDVIITSLPASDKTLLESLVADAKKALTEAKTLLEESRSSVTSVLESATKVELAMAVVLEAESNVKASEENTKSLQQACQELKQATQSYYLECIRSAGDSLSAKDEAKASADKAKVSETNSKTSETSASAYKMMAEVNSNTAMNAQQRAMKWAENPENEEVSPGQYSAKHWAKVSERNSGAVSNAIVFRGPWDITQGAPPTPTPETPDFYKVTVPGTLNGIEYALGDSLVWDTSGDSWFKIDGTDHPITDELDVDSSVIVASAKAAMVLDQKKQDKNVPAAMADKWSTLRNITLSGGATGTQGIDGSEDVELAVSVVDDGHNHTTATITGLDTELANRPTREEVDEKVGSAGKVESVNSKVGIVNLTAADIPNAFDVKQKGYYPIACSPILGSYSSISCNSIQTTKHVPYLWSEERSSGTTINLGATTCDLTFFYTKHTPGFDEDHIKFDARTIYREGNKPTPADIGTLTTEEINTALDGKSPKGSSEYRSSSWMPKASDVGAVSKTGDTMTGRLSLNYGDPTILLQDIDAKSTFLHCNSNQFYILRSAGNNGTTWDSGPNGRHPMILSLDNGDVTFSGNVTAYSDQRLKTDIKRIDNALDKVCQIKGVTFHWKDDSEGVGEQVGLIGQDVQAVMPQAVTENKEGHLLVAYANLVGLLVEAIKELKEEVDQMRGAA